jgi:hypothetical protein
MRRHASQSRKLIKMDDETWATFLRTCADVLGVEKATRNGPCENGSWCAWTTFDSLQDSVNYWRGPLPTREEIFDSYVGHGANWDQFFNYRQMCHFLVPRTFFWERTAPGTYERGNCIQDLDALAQNLNTLNVPHRLTPLVLEIKLF